MIRPRKLRHVWDLFVIYLVPWPVWAFFTRTFWVPYRYGTASPTGFPFRTNYTLLYPEAGARYFWSKRSYRDRYMETYEKNPLQNPEV